MLINLRTTGVDGFDVVEVAGEVDASTVADLEIFVSDLDTPTLIFDMTGVTFMDTTGIRFLVSLSNQLSKNNRKMRLVVTEQSPVYLMLKLTGLVDQFTIVQPG